MDIKIDINGMPKLSALIGMLGPSNRLRLNTVAAKSLEVSVRRHVGRLASVRHRTAATLGAPETGHIVKGMRGIVGTASADGGSVVIPIPGISRAWHDIDLSTPTRNGKKYITIPKHAAAYGHTVSYLRARGWTIFRPGSKRVLLGYKRKGDKPELLYTLATHVHQPKDPTLLPSQEECARIVSSSMANEINRRIAAAKGAK